MEKKYQKKKSSFENRGMDGWIVTLERKGVLCKNVHFSILYSVTHLRAQKKLKERCSPDV